MVKWEALRSKNKHFALYVLQSMSFPGVVKYSENCCQTKFKKRANIDHFGAIGFEIFEIVEICGCLRKSWIFDELKLAKSSSRK